MKTNFLFECLIIGTIVISSCQKQPTASFKTDKTTYTAGETVHLTNTSTDGASYLWTFPDGQTGTIANYDYTLNVNDPDGILSFKLKAFSKNGKKTNETSQSITEKAATGSISFWQSGTPSYSTTTVNINGTTAQITVDSPSGITDCITSGHANFTLKVGTYSFTASESGGTTWSGSATITKDGCLKFQLQ